jgi:hypothetical protein
MERLEYAKGFTIKAIVLALIIAAIMIPIRITRVSYSAAFQVEKEYQVLWWAFWPIIVGAILTTVGKKFKFSGPELAVAYTIILIMGTVPNIGGKVVFPGVVSRGFGAAVNWYTNNMSPYWAPSDTATREVLWTGGALDWAAWTIPLMWWLLFYISGHMFLLFWTAILRKQFIEVESVPYPWATPYSELVNMATTKEEGKSYASLFRNWYFLIGLILTFIWVFQADYLKWFFDYTLPKGVAAYTFDVLNLTPYAYITGIIWLNINIPYVALGYILPNDLLLTVVTSSIILLMIVPELLARLAVIPPLPAGTWYSWQHIMYLGQSTELAWGYLGMFWGIFFALGAYPLIMHRQLLVNSFKSLLGNNTKDMEENEPMGYRNLWIGMFVFLIVWIIAIIISGAPIEYTLLTVVTMFFFQTAFARYWGEAGVTAGLAQQYRYYQVYTAPLATVNQPGAFATLTANMTFEYSNADPYGKTMTYGMETYKVGELLKTRSKDIFIAQIIGTMIALFASIFGSFLWLQSVGMSLGAGWFGTPWGQPGISGHGNPYQHINQARYYPVAPNYFTLGMFIFGVALTVVMYTLRARYPKFLFAPAGILIPMFWTKGPGYWLSFLIALLAKWILIKIGGRKYYDIGMSVVIGVLLGCGLAYGVGLSLRYTYDVWGFPKPGWA